MSFASKLFLPRSASPNVFHNPPPWFLLFALVLVMAACVLIITSATNNEYTAAAWAIPAVLGVPGFLGALLMGYRKVAFTLLGIASVSFVVFCLTLIF